MGIDQSTRGTGICIWEPRSKEIIYAAKLEQTTKSNKKTMNKKILIFHETGVSGRKIREVKPFIVKDGNPYYKIQRIQLIVDWVKSMISDFDVKHINIEGASFGSRGLMVDIGMILGCLELTFTELKIPYNEYPPKTVKKYLTGNGNATKPDMVAAVEQIFQLETAIDDIADATALAAIEELKKLRRVRP